MLATNGGKPVIPTWMLVAFAWLLMVIVSGGAAPFQGHGWPPVGGDQAWRMVEAVDLANGQAWTDTTQYRDNTPYGSPMHWSRLIDAPLAALVLAFRPIYGADAAFAAASLWPMLVLVPYLILAALLGQRLAGPAARLPTLLVAVLDLNGYAAFVSGNVDHHNVEMVLILGLMLATVSGRTSRGAAAIAGVISATALAIAIECLPGVLAALVLFPLFWVMDPKAGRGPALAFALAFALGLAGHLLLVTDFRALLVPACDALSVTFVFAGFAYSIAVVALVLLASGVAHPALRFVLMGVGAVAALGATVALFPECLGGPYASLDPDLAKVLLTDISEAQPLWRWLGNVIGGTGGLIVLPILGIVGSVAAAKLARGEKRLDWLVIAGFAVLLALVTLVQVRGLRLAVLPALPVGGWAIATAWAAFRTRPGLLRGVGVAASVVAFAGVLHVVGAFVLLPNPREAPETAYAHRDCQLTENLQHLAALPKGRIISYLLIGPSLLMNTPHSIVSAGYHRGKQGMRDALDFASKDEATALRIARERGLNYFVFCKGVPLNSGLHDLPDFQGITEAGVRWSWLKPLTTPDEIVQVYAIDLPAN